VLEHAFGYDTALSIIVEFVGGIVFLTLILRGLSR
jgi:iron complex transport system permease protein